MLNIGPGLSGYIQAHQMTPLTDEFGFGTPWRVSCVEVEVGNAAGQKTHSVVSWDHELNAVIEAGAGPVLPTPPAPAPTPTLMYDSTEAAAIPADAQVVAGYIDGAFAWSKADWDRFQIPDSQKITITVFGGQLAAVCDCETGDLTPDEAASWIQSYPGNIVYCNLSTAPAVVQAMKNAGMAGLPGESTQFYLWIADWTGVPHIPDVPGATVVACQYADPATGSGGHYDLSLLTPTFLQLF